MERTAQTALSTSSALSSAHEHFEQSAVKAHYERCENVLQAIGRDPDPIVRHPDVDVLPAASSDEVS